MWGLSGGVSYYERHAVSPPALAPVWEGRAPVSAQRTRDQPEIPGFSYVRPLGSGGFAQVHLYEQDLPRRAVAVKVLDVAPERRDVFEHEADVMAGLSSHPSIVAIYQAGVTLAGRPYLAMEYCPASMGALTKERPAQLREVLDAGVRLAGALETAHRAGVLHRDIKPSNVLLTALGKPALSDFGIARSAATPAPVAEEVAMSIPWSAPEVVTLETPGTVTSEVWSLAATLYTFAAGRSPFAALTHEQNTRAKLIARIRRAEVVPIPGASGYGPFDAVLARAMRRNASERYASMEEFGRAVQELQRGYGFDVTPLEVIAEAWLPAPVAPTPAPITPGQDTPGQDTPGQDTPGQDAPGQDVSGQLTPAGLSTDPVAPAPRGPVVSTVPGRVSRSQARAAAQPNAGAGGRDGTRGTRAPRGTRGTRGSTGAWTDPDGVAPDRPASAVRAGLLGAGIALGGVALVGGIIWLLGGGAW